jgi:hypothetical protein
MLNFVKNELLFSSHFLIGFIRLLYENVWFQKDVPYLAV